MTQGRPGLGRKPRPGDGIGLGSCESAIPTGNAVEEIHKDVTHLPEIIITSRSNTGIAVYETLVRSRLSHRGTNLRTTGGIVLATRPAVHRR
jgi:hypothetical protein